MDGPSEERARPSSPRRGREVRYSPALRGCFPLAFSDSGLPGSSRFVSASAPVQPGNLLLAVAGGIAAYKIPELVRQLRRAGHAVRCVLTEAGGEFVSPLVLQTLSGAPVRSSLFDSGEEGEISHIELADWADLVVVAPATANRIAKLAQGLADDLVGTLLLATRAPVLLVPAMNVNMWSHPATRANAGLLRERGVHFEGPESGELACGWEGEGRMAEPGTIAGRVAILLGGETWKGVRVLVSAGGTREPIDAVRSIANRSSGKMGFAVAEEAARRGAEVVLVAGPCALPTPPGVRRLDVETALEMAAAVEHEFETCQVAVMAAAVADFRPANASLAKIKKEDLAPGAAPRIDLVQNPDILAGISATRGERVVVGFAAESHDLVEAARRKLARKGCDLLVANDISRVDAGFDTDSNAVTFVSPGGEVDELPLLPKVEVAARILDRVEKLREGPR
ncbi:MAG: bifunctional phosphopantothenoylcysteine decarboxylase/phosphopantothenate--cysteine ligase CoaBC [bacterium]|nr:bifunctional phosphopantothenoylcysteine decarboxylase/phosphopantothenate--cysteine ligase CoaBC [bacterium]